MYLSIKLIFVQIFLECLISDLVLLKITNICYYFPLKVLEKVSWPLDPTRKLFLARAEKKLDYPDFDQVS